MTGHWMQQTVTTLVGVHLLVAAAVGGLLVALLLPIAHRRHIRRSQVLITRIALVAFQIPVPRPSVDGPATGAGTPDPAPVVAPRVRVTHPRHRLVA
jgi:hypothetical protein